MTITKAQKETALRSLQWITEEAIKQSLKGSHEYPIVAAATLEHAGKLYRFFYDLEVTDAAVQNDNK